MSYSRTCMHFTCKRDLGGKIRNPACTLLDVLRSARRCHGLACCLAVLLLSVLLMLLVLLLLLLPSLVLSSLLFTVKLVAIVCSVGVMVC